MKTIKLILAVIFLCVTIPAMAATKYTSQINILLPEKTVDEKAIKKNILENAKKRIAEIEELLKKASSIEQIQGVHTKSEEQLREVLKPYGYFNAKISSELKMNPKTHTWKGSFTVYPGPRIKVNKTELVITGAGKYDPEFKIFISEFPLKKNQYLNTEIYKAEKQKLIDLAAARGYFDARLTKSAIEIDMKNYTANIILHLNTNKRYRFGCVTFLRTDITPKPLTDSFLQRFIPFKKNDYYDQSLLRTLQQNLSNGQYFQQVVVQPDYDKIQRNQIPIIVKLTSSKSKRYNFGLGYGTDTGPRGLAGIELRRLTNTGHYFTGEIRGALQDKTPSGLVKMTYNIPGWNPAKDLFRFSLEADQDQDEDYGLSRTAKLGANYITEFKRWQQTLGVTWHWELSKPEDEIPFTTSLIIPSAQWQRVISDDPLHPSNGYKLNLSLRGSSQYLLSDTSFFQAHFYAKYLHSFTDNLMLLARAELGAILIDDLEDLPLSLRFFAGGSNSVRGYGYRNIKDGRNLAIGSVELQHRLYKHFYGSVFFDAGNVSSNLFSNEYDKSVGVGLVYKSVIGSISLTVAQALDKPGQPRRVEFSMGPDL